jgi:hypothetical protein
MEFPLPISVNGSLMFECLIENEPDSPERTGATATVKDVIHGKAPRAARDGSITA